MTAAAGPAHQAPCDWRSWTIPVPWAASMVPVVRAFARAFLGGHPHAADAELITSEYVTNALRYTAPADGGVIQVTVATTAGTVRVEVTGPGPPRGPGAPTACDASGEDANGEDEHGRGLLIVDALAARWGHYGPGDGPLTAWAELGEPDADDGHRASAWPWS